MGNKITVKAEIPQTVNYVATSVSIGTTTVLGPNEPATVTNSGTAQNAVLNFGIPSTSADFTNYRTSAAQDAIDITKQPKTLSESITVNGQSQTTVEGALNAINENSSIANVSLSNLNESGENHFANPSFSNITNDGKQAIVNNVMLDYENVVSVDGITAGVYTQVAKDSFVVTWGSDAYTEDYYVYVSPDNGTTKYIVGRRYDDQNGQTQATSFPFFVPKGWYFTNNVEAGYSARIYPLKGAQ